jgi:hypothetical protein
MHAYAQVTHPQLTIDWRLLTTEPEQFKAELLERFDTTAEKCNLSVK